VKKALEITLGIVTSVGGFLEIGSLATAAQAGAQFGFQLTWAIALGTVCLIFLVEMSGRFSAVSHHTVVDAMRERFGFDFFLIPLVFVGLVTLLVLVAELGGVCLALQLVTGLAFPWFALPVGFAVWLLLWKGTFGVIEEGVSLLGLVTVCFLVAVFWLHAPLRDVAAGLIPSRPAHDRAQYWFIAVSILGASISPYLFYFYSSGAIEDRWDESHLTTNRMVATLGMTFGGVLSAAVLVVAAIVFEPRNIRIERYDQIALILTEPFGWWGFVLFAISLGIACLGAALEITLALTYMVSQGFGWMWGKNARPREAARFTAMYTSIVIVATLFVLTGLEPLKLTVLSMALTAATLPIAVVPFLVLMNDEHYVGDHGNSWVGNTIVLLITALAFVLAVVSLPLEIAGS